MTSPAEWLFPEILEVVFSHLELKDLLACSGVNRTWNEAANRIKLWRKFVSKKNLSWLPRSVDCELHSSSSFSSSSTLTSPFSTTPPSSSSYSTSPTTDYNSNASFNHSPSSTLPASNPYKKIIQQRNQIKHNWANGFITEYDLIPADYNVFSITTDIEVKYPSSAPQDCLYFLLLDRTYRANFQYECLFVNVFRFDSGQVKFICTLPVELNEGSVLVFCVMKDYIVWLLRSGKVQYISLPTCDICCESSFKDCKVKTLKTINPNHPIEKYYLNMDTNHIVASSCGSICVWNKKSLELALFCTSPSNTPNLMLNSRNDPICLDDGYLIICYSNYEKDTALIEEYNLETKSKLQTKLKMQSTIYNVKCFGDVVVMFYLEGDWESQVLSFQVRQKNNLEQIIFSCRKHPKMDYHFVGNSLLINNKPDLDYMNNFNDVRIIDLSTGAINDDNEIPYFRSFLHLFDNLVLIQVNDHIDVWDLKNSIRKVLCNYSIEEDDQDPNLRLATPKWLVIYFKTYLKILMVDGEVK